ncbi:protein prenylyltransferase [Gigaspora margarita]|uniref:Protein prenylyltransferase n=1 Tax=Gigaspora margarita TaxID=4874 RepID=A0A8H3WYV1_GIGMA|nr:protein prenylyltransferase [Gigaspora margarita]
MSMDAKTLYELLNKIIDSHQIEEICLLPYQNALSKDQYYPFLLIGSNLGIPLEHLHKIFKQAHGIFMNLYVDRNQGYSNDKLIAYINNDDKEAIELIKQSTRCLLLLNPDFYTATNARKKLILNNLLDPSEELKFINLIFTFPKHTKNSTIWHHRKWIISNIISRHQSDNKFDITVLFRLEIPIIQRVVELYPKNYYAWTHRHWIISQLPIDSSLSLSFLDDELLNMEKWVRANVSDHSGFHHRQLCLLKKSQFYNSTIVNFLGISRDNLLGQPLVLENLSYTKMDQIILLWFNEIRFTRDLILRYPGHETLWYNLRFLSTIWKWLSFLGHIHPIDSKNIEPYEDGENIVLNLWPGFENDLEFSRYCILMNSDVDDEHVTLQKRSAIAYELWISELHGASKNNLDSLISKLAEIAPESNYYLCRNLSFHGTK